MIFLHKKTASGLSKTREVVHRHGHDDRLRRIMTPPRTLQKAQHDFTEIECIFQIERVVRKNAYFKQKGGY